MPTLQDFVSKWKRDEARERQSVQEHFIDLCALVEYETSIQDGGYMIPIRMERS